MPWLRAQYVRNYCFDMCMLQSLQCQLYQLKLSVTRAQVGLQMQRCHHMPCTVGCTAITLNVHIVMNMHVHMFIIINMISIIDVYQLRYVRIPVSTATCAVHLIMTHYIPHYRSDCRQKLSRIFYGRPADKQAAAAPKSDQLIPLILGCGKPTAANGN